MPVVLDASAMVELLMRTRAAAAVEAEILGDDAFAPELLDVEVASVLFRLERSRRIDAAQSRGFLRALLDAPIMRVPHAGLLPGAWDTRENLSAYDGVYVALAARLGCPLVTGDRRLAAAPGLGVTITVVA